MTHSLVLRSRLTLLLVGWLVLWAIIVATWMYDADGYAIGMPSVVFLVSMLGPLLVGFVLGWGKASPPPAAKAGMAGGVVYGLANMVAQLVWGLILRVLGRIPLDTIAQTGGPWVFLFEIVEFTVLFTVTGLFLGLVGGLLGAAVSRLAGK